MSPDLVRLRFALGRAAADWTPDEERWALGTFDALVVEMEELQDCILWLLTEMPVWWEEVALAEGCSDVVAIAQKVVTRGG